VEIGLSNQPTPGILGGRMSQETITYLTNIVIGAILAGLLTHFWWRQGRSATMRCWMLSAWVMTVADIFFALRPELPYWAAKLIPTLLVTVGHAGLFLGAQRTAEIPRQWKLALGIILLHLAVLISFLTFAQPATWRMVSNGVIWGGLSLASYWCLRRARPVFWRSLVAPANAFLLHGLFHGLRVGLAVLLGGLGWTEASASLQIIGDLEVSFFMVALFVSLLLANLQLRHEELSCAHAEVQTLSGLLPICAWCKKVRDDAGYWQQVEDYFSARSQIEFTHGMCNDCFNVQRVGKPRT
jgi:hypothetical protein